MGYVNITYKSYICIILSGVLSNFVKRGPSTFTTELWISRADGQMLHPLASDEYEQSSGTPPEDLHWTPDGRSLSFLYKVNCYTLSRGRHIFT